MERLTVKLNGTYEIKGIEDVPCGDVCERNHGCETCKIHEAVEKLAEYENAEEQGLLLRLPCKIGRKVFYVQKCLAHSCKECKGFLRVDNCYCQYKARIFEQKFDYRHLKAFGKSVFLTKEEAEQALVEMEKGNSK